MWLAMWINYAKNQLVLKCQYKGQCSYGGYGQQSSGVLQQQSSGELRTGKGSEITWRHDCWRVAAASENSTFKNIAY